MGNEVGRELSPEEMKSRDIKSMDSEMKWKMEKKGIRYNRERSTGKSCLWGRLQGQPFIETYNPTSEIQVCTINWDYKATNDIVKVEVWDVVDRAKSKEVNTGLKTSEEKKTQEGIQFQMPANISKGTSGSFTIEKLDSTTVDVYKGAHALIVMMDPTKKWTYDFARKEIENAPQGIDIMLVVNYRDMGDNRTVKEKDIEEWVRLQPNRRLKSVEASMKNTFGLRAIVSFFNLPFLRLQREYIEAQLRKNDEEIETVSQELEMSKEQTYEIYIKNLEIAAQEKKSVPSNPPTSSNPAAAFQRATSSGALQTPVEAPQQQRNLRESAPPAMTQANTPSAVPQQPQPPRSPTVNQTAPVQTAPVQQAQPQAQSTQPKKSIFSLFKSAVSGDNKEAQQKESPQVQPQNPNIPAMPLVDPKKVVDDLKKMSEAKIKPTLNIDDFATGDLADDFFGGDSPAPTQSTTPPSRLPSLPKFPKREEQEAQKPQEIKKDKKPKPKPVLLSAEDDDDEEPNSLVARHDFDDDESSEEEPPKVFQPVKQPPKAAVITKPAPLSSSSNFGSSGSNDLQKLPSPSSSSNFAGSKDSIESFNPTTPSSPRATMTSPFRSSSSFDSRASQFGAAGSDDDESPNPFVTSANDEDDSSDDHFEISSKFQSSGAANVIRAQDPVPTQKVEPVWAHKKNVKAAKTEDDSDEENSLVAKDESDSDEEQKPNPKYDNEDDDDIFNDLAKNDSLDGMADELGASKGTKDLYASSAFSKKPKSSSIASAQPSSYLSDMSGTYSTSGLKVAQAATVVEEPEEKEERKSSSSRKSSRSSRGEKESRSDRDSARSSRDRESRTEKESNRSEREKSDKDNNRRRRSEDRDRSDEKDRERRKSSSSRDKKDRENPSSSRSSRSTKEGYEDL